MDLTGLDLNSIILLFLGGLGLFVLSRGQNSFNDSKRESIMNTFVVDFNKQINKLNNESKLLQSDNTDLQVKLARREGYYEAKIEQLTAQLKRHEETMSENDALNQTVKRLEERIAVLEEQVKKLMSDNEFLREENKRLQSEKAAQEAENIALEAENEKLKKVIAAKEAELKQLKDNKSKDDE